ncbi:tRNA pseudouridine(55) synthase TruB [Enterococcus songbeiensis]|uniref:tRNA pseudouridine(55) synthase TruB n=1 Tax=Enterococcus songbeiensis TaxID=2559927 RepID=UPI0010F813FD|nr:tRNA pseudouridine(55) synthase TruB [Enterococcus songbeiensis]
MDGILPLWKERGMTSHDCVFQLRKILHTKKIGHSGTLDPDVDGVLPICIGKGTKMVEFLMESGKTYVGEITLGFATTTEDASGEVVERTVIQQPFSNKAIDEAMASLTGEITQIPPMFSAVKVNGRRLYDYARAGEIVERPERKAQIFSFERISEPVWENGTQSWRFQVRCGKGTYVRTLAVDTGKKLQVAAHMSDLTRIASGGFTKAQAVTLQQVRELVDQNQLEAYLLPIEYGVKEFPRVDLSDALWQKIKNGMRLPFSAFQLAEMPQEPIALFYQEKVVGIYEKNNKNPEELKPRKMFRTE